MPSYPYKYYFSFCLSKNNNNNNKSNKTREFLFSRACSKRGVVEEKKNCLNSYE